jgi:hypothetical protein
MKFTIPFNMCAFLVAASKSQSAPDFGAFVWGYRINSPVVWIGLYRTLHCATDHTCYTIELLDGGSIDVDGMVTIPDQFLPYVVARDNKVYRAQYVIGDTITTTRGHELKFDEVQPVLYHEYGISGQAKEPSRPASSEPDLPNRVREEGV